MRRRIARFVFVTVLAAVATVAGVATALTLTPPGRDLLARTVSAELSRVINGSIDIGSISGSFLYDLTLERLVVRDTAGVLLADLPRVRVAYQLPNLIAGRFVLSRLHADRPVLQLIKHRDGRMNYEDVLRLGGGKGAGRSPLIEFRDVRVRDGTVRLELPWSPPASLTTERQRDSALAAERAKPGRVIEPSVEGLRRVVEFERVAGRFRRMRISTPDRRPFTLDLDSLATRISDPQVDLRDAAGRVRLGGDSLVFSLHRGALPGTRFSGGGAVTWPQDTVLYDFQIVAPRASLADLRWVSPKFPDFRGRAVLAARSETGTRTAFHLTDLHLARGSERVDGSLTALDDKRRGLGVRDLRLRSQALDLDAVRPYVPDLPFFGTVTGATDAGGYLDDLAVDVDWAFADDSVPGRPVTRISAEGRVGLGGGQTIVFRDVLVRDSDVDLRTVRRLAPAVILHGRLAARGRLDGALRDVTFEGTARHQDGERPASEIDGIVRLDTRGDTLALATDVALQPLSFDGIRASFPGLTARGRLTGRVRLDGTLGNLAVDASVSGEVGTIEAVGTATVLPPHWGADSLRIDFRGLDLDVLNDSAPSTNLNGSLLVSGVADSARAPDVELVVELGRSRVREFRVDTLLLAGSVHDSLIRVDTVEARVARVSVRGGGALGWAQPHQGELRLALATDSLGVFDSLLHVAAGVERDTAADAGPLGGAVRGTLTLARSLDSLRAAAELEGRRLEWQRFRAPRATASIAYDGGARPQLAVSGVLDSLTRRRRLFRDVGFGLEGPTDSLAWRVTAALGDTGGARLGGRGRWWDRAGTRGVAVDSFAARLALHDWRLAAPATVTLSDSAPAVAPFVLATEDGSGRISAYGRLPGDTPGELAIDAFGIEVADVMALLQDSVAVSGEVGLALEVGGTARAPAFTGSAWLADAMHGKFRGPLAQTIVDYRDRRLAANLFLWRTGNQLLQVEASLPLDLGFRDVRRRRIDGPLRIHARADSADFALIEAVLPGVHDVEGQVVAEAQIEGTWEQPTVSGFANVSRGAMTIPGIGVRYAAILGRAEFRADSLLIPYALVTSGGGTMQITGNVHLEDLSRPVLNLDLEANKFQALNVRNLLSLTTTGNLQLRGPVLNARATGRALVDEGVLYFADLISKNVINLEDPTIRDIVDTTLIRRANLGARFENRFLDSLRVDELELEMGTGVFLRSNEANIQLGGDITVNKVRREYRPSGTLEALRGQYVLKFPFAGGREFRVERGTVTYFGTPDLNAELDLTARHDAQTVRGDVIPISAHITGTLQAPRVALESPIRPPLPESELVSYLVFGQPSSSVLAVQGGNRELGLAVSYFSTAAVSELERALISDLGVPLDFIEIQPGAISPGVLGASAQTRLAIGKRIGAKTFVTLSAGFCPNQGVDAGNFGASLEYRISRAWRTHVSFEPTRSYCTTSGFANVITTSRYQIGADIFWEREF
ncbi:MAG TPA: translocation/assembly module TamB domain-containing protein [Gemmatimonadales bacterium]|nr:translocation/assembly module TamB domain-containing protein [Gemmatimonadales bacterium]